jgi:hypothetical protein
MVAGVEGVPASIDCGTKPSAPTTSETFPRRPSVSTIKTKQKNVLDTRCPLLLIHASAVWARDETTTSHSQFIYLPLLLLVAHVNRVTVLRESRLVGVTLVGDGRGVGDDMVAEIEMVVVEIEVVMEIETVVVVDALGCCCQDMKKKKFKNLKMYRECPFSTLVPIYPARLGYTSLLSLLEKSMKNLKRRKRKSGLERGSMLSLSPVLVCSARLEHAGLLVGPAYSPALFRTAESWVASWERRHRPGGGGV